MLTDGILLMVGCIIFFMLLFVSKTLNEKLEFEQEQAYMVQTQEISQYTGAPFSMSFDKIMNPDYINPPIEMRMIALTVMLMIAAVIVPVVIFNSDISLLDSGSPNSLVVKYPELDATLTDNGDAANDELNVRHIQGDDLDWSEYKIVITSTADEDVTTTLNDLSSLGIINASQT